VPLRKLPPWRTPAAEAWDLWGWSDFDDEHEVTTMPIVDRSAGLFARHTLEDALAVARFFRGELLRRADVDRLIATAYMIEPSIVREDPGNGWKPTAIRAAPDVRRLSQDLSNMASFDWCLAHDQDVFTQLGDRWDGRPVMNLGKWWTPEGSICGWYQGGRLIQQGTRANLHGMKHHDFATLTMIKRRKGIAV
jgi:hypothetical protein